MLASCTTTPFSLSTENIERRSYLGDLSTREGRVSISNILQAPSSVFERRHVRTVAFTLPSCSESSSEVSMLALCVDKAMTQSAIKWL